MGKEVPDSDSEQLS
jgi:hypothetical protein